MAAHAHAITIDVIERRRWVGSVLCITSTWRWICACQRCGPWQIRARSARNGGARHVVAAKNLGIRAVGIEREERYCEIAVKRLAQRTLSLGVG